MDRIRQRTTGDYQLSATAYDSAGVKVNVSGTPLVTIYDAAGVAVIEAASPTITDGALSYGASIADLDTLGVYRAVWTAEIDGVGQEWTTYFELVTGLALDLLAEVKLSLRITATPYDDEILSLIDAARDDMKLSGVSTAALTEEPLDPLIRRAVVVYCKAHFGLDNADSEKYAASYTSLKTHLSLSTEYQEPPA